MKRVLLTLFALASFGQTSLLFAQCAMCKTLLTNSPEGRAISGRFNVAILVMLAAPYLVTSGVLLALYRDRLLKRLAVFGHRFRLIGKHPA